MPRLSRREQRSYPNRQGTLAAGISMPLFQLFSARERASYHTIAAWLNYIDFDLAGCRFPAGHTTSSPPPMGVCGCSRISPTRAIIGVMMSMQGAGWLHSHAWVLMPDHLHWLFTLGERASLSATMDRFISGSSHQVIVVRPDLARVWQEGFFDHGVRREEDLRTIARYLVANPLRAGLCGSVGEYPWWDAELL